MGGRAKAKQRVTFRVDPELAGALRNLPNQTAFVERTLREALGRLCPVCAGSGEAPDVQLAATSPDGELEFRLARSNELLLTGRIPRGQTDLSLTH